MDTLRCFEDNMELGRLDRESFLARHKLMGHPSLSLDNLGKVLPALPPSNVMYSKSSLANGDDFETTFRDRPEGVSVSEVLESIRESSSYIMISSPEKHPSFHDLYRELKSDVEVLMRRRGIGGEALMSKLYLFIASPNQITPFHVDRYSTILMQFRGSKTISVFPQWEDAVVKSEDLEAYCDYERTKLPWSESLDKYGKPYSFAPGDAVHIPFMAGHHVANGSDDVSISLSIIFNTDETMVWRNALCMNHRLRRRLPMVGRSVSPVGRSALRDQVKDFTYRGIGYVARRIGREW